MLKHGRVLEPDTASLSLDEVPLAEVLQNEVDRFPRQPDEIRDIPLAQAQGDNDPVGVFDPVAVGEMEERACNARMGALVQDLANPRPIHPHPQAEERDDLLAQRGELSHQIQKIGARDDPDRAILVRISQMVVRAVVDHRQFAEEIAWLLKSQKMMCQLIEQTRKSKNDIT